MGPELKRLLITASNSSAENFSKILYEIILNEFIDTGSRNEPPPVELARLLASDPMRPARGKIAAALAHGATTWSLPATQNNLCVSVALLFKKFSSRELAITLVQRLLEKPHSAEVALGSNPYVDLFLDAVLCQITDATVRARCVDVAMDLRFERFVPTIFIHLTKSDVTSVPFIMDRLIEVAPHLPTISGVPGYITAFDRDLNLADVTNILNALQSSQVPSFSRHFLAYSTRFLISQKGITDATEIEPSMLTMDDFGPLVVKDERRGGIHTIAAQAAVFTGGLQYLRDNRSLILSEMAELGVKSKPLLAA